MTLAERLRETRTLERAWYSLSRSNPESHGLSGLTIKEFATNLDDHIDQIQTQLRNDNYQFSELRGVAIHKDSGNDNIRPIRIPEIRDRLVSRALVGKISGPLDEHYDLQNDASFAYHKNAGVRRGWAKVLNYYHDYRPWVFETDIRDFFGTIDRDRLLEEFIFPALPDDSLNDLLRQAVQQQVGNLKDLEKQGHAAAFTDAGIPQGSSLSPLFSNVYLAEFDHTMLAEDYDLVRYADDFIVICESRQEARDAYQRSREILEGNLDLNLHPLDDEDSKTRISPVSEGFSFLGVYFDGNRMMPGKTKKEAVRQIIDEATYVTRNGPRTVLSLLQDLRNRVQGWVASFAHTDVSPLLEQLDAHINRRLATGLRIMGWRHRGEGPLSGEQRRRSGVAPLSDYLSSVRGSMLKKHVTLFEEYWSD